jgi:hypothetical protein
VDFSKVMEGVRRLRAGVGRYDLAGRFRNLGVDVFFGQARCVGRDRV